MSHRRKTIMIWLGVPLALWIAGGICYRRLKLRPSFYGSAVGIELWRPLKGAKSIRIEDGVLLDVMKNAMERGHLGTWPGSPNRPPGTRPYHFRSRFRFKARPPVATWMEFLDSGEWFTITGPQYFFDDPLYLAFEVPEKDRPIVAAFLKEVFKEENWGREVVFSGPASRSR